MGLLLLTLSSCTAVNLLKKPVYQDSRLTDTPEEFVRQNFKCNQDPPNTPLKFNVLGTRKWSRGVIVLYKGLCPSVDGQAPPQQVFGFQTFEATNSKWRFAQGDDTTFYSSPDSIDEPAHMILLQRQLSDDNSLIYGQLFSNRVAAVEVTFDNGQIVRDDKITDGVFALVGPKKGTSCELRLLNANNRLILRKSLTNNNKPGAACPSS